MKIGFIILRSDTGGGPRHLSDLLNHLKHKEPSIEIHTAAPKDAPYGNEFNRLSDSFFQLEHRKFSFLTLLKVFFHFKKMQVQVIHSHGRGAGIYSGLLAILGFKVIHTFHGLNPTSGKQESIKSWIEKVVWFKVSKFISVSISEAKTAKLKYGIQDTSVIPNGIDLDMVEVIENRLIRTQRLKTNNTVKVRLGTISRLDPHKNNHTLIQKFKTLPENFFLDIAGNGEQLESLQDLISKLKLNDRVRLLGAVANPYQFLNSIDVFVSASLSEGLPYSVLEAQAIGLPCVLSNVQGHTEISNALFFDLNSTNPASDFVAAVARASQNLLPSITLQFDINKMIDKNILAYKAMVQS